MIDVKAKIDSFFIFNSELGPNEGEESKKILFFHPSNVSMDSRKILVGLCEAVIKFMSTFSSEPCEALQTQTKRHIFYQPEKNFWMVIVVRIPYTAKSLPGSADGSNEMVVPSVIHNLLVSAYKMFKMFMGPFVNIPVEDLYQKCDNFFLPYLCTKNIANEVSDVIQGVSYLPLDKNSFFKVLCFIDLIEVKYPDFKCVSFVYNDQLVWNNLAKEDMLTLYQYIVEVVLPEQITKEIQGGAVAAAQRHGRYISPSGGIRTSEDISNISKVYLSEEDGSEAKQYYLIIYRTLSATLCFTVDATINLELETLRSLDAYIGPQLSSLASVISEEHVASALQNANISSDAKVIYFNRINLAYKTLMCNKLIPSTAVKPEVLSIISEMHKDKRKLSNYGELIIKTPDEYWITGKMSNEREIYVVIQQKGANLKVIADQVKRICEAQMKGLFFYPI